MKEMEYIQSTKNNCFSAKMEMTDEIRKQLMEMSGIQVSLVFSLKCYYIIQVTILHWPLDSGETATNAVWPETILKRPL